MSYFFVKAESNKKIIYNVAGKNETFILNVSYNAIVSEKCNKNRCQALSLLEKKASLDCSAFLFFNDRNPTNVICLDHLHANIKIGIDERGNETSICYFNDNSSVIADSLVRICK